MKGRGRKTVRFLLIAAAAATAVLFFCRIRPYVVTSGSMAPAVPAGSLCLVRREIPFEKVKEGDIIAFRTSLSGTVIHRVVGKGEEALTTRGDANTLEDGEPVTEDNLVGRVVLTLPFLGFAFAYAAQPAGRFLLTAGCVFLIGWLCLSGSRKQERKERRAAN